MCKDVVVGPTEVGDVSSHGRGRWNGPDDGRDDGERGPDDCKDDATEGTDAVTATLVEEVGGKT
jgi:hypothetical protein